MSSWGEGKQRDNIPTIADDDGGRVITGCCSPTACGGKSVEGIKYAR